ncbi:MAG: NAD+ synthase [Balneolaceae bacterium]|nr:NAD+ synthase [Balneolaceae bacterium]
MGEAASAGVELLILPELVTAAYSPMDLLERPAFREALYAANRELVAATSGAETGLLFGTVTANTSGTGRPCYNSALLASGGELLGEVHKALLPTYDVFDELRYFESNRGPFEPLAFRGRALGVTVCEDLWQNENEIQYHTYDTSPAAELAERGAQCIINISASPYTRGKPASRLKMLRRHVERLELPLFYANQVGANTELIHDGDSMALDARGRVAARVPLFEEGWVDLRWEEDGSLQALDANPESSAAAEPPEAPESVFRALVLGVRDYFGKTGVSDSAVLGLSGGIDSALVACIAAEALGPGRVTALTMPSAVSSEGSVTDSEAQARNLGIQLHEVPVDGLYERYAAALEPVIGRPGGHTAENLQPRIRQTLLMAFSNDTGALLLNTGNKSELATGYCTLYGDMAGALGVIADLYKMEVYEMARWLNREHYGREVIPRAVLEKAPSAELAPGQTDQDRLPPYKELDGILRRYLELQEGPEEIAGAGYDPQTVRRIVRMVQQNEFKRFQAVPGLKVSVKAFGSGRRWPLAQG